MATDDERRRVAERLREFTKDNQWPLTVGGNSSTIRYAISDIVFGDKKYHSGVDLLDRLADLIEPDTNTDTTKGIEFDAFSHGIDSIYEWCRERLEGADGAEDYLYCSIMSAIEEYRHPERVTARTARPVDRRALLRLADKVFEDTEGDMSTRGKLMPAFIAGQCLRDVASRIRVLCGEEDS